MKRVSAVGSCKEKSWAKARCKIFSRYINRALNTLDLLRALLSRESTVVLGMERKARPRLRKCSNLSDATLTQERFSFRKAFAELFGIPEGDA